MCALYCMYYINALHQEGLTYIHWFTWTFDILLQIMVLFGRNGECHGKILESGFDIPLFSPVARSCSSDPPDK